ncbi:MAG: cytochrome c oxidase assembly protein [Salegentibacter sp.]
MDLMHYILLPQNWSLASAVILFVLLGVFWIWFRPGIRKMLSMTLALSLIYLATASPLAHLRDFGLHSITMIQQVILLLIVPVFLWSAVPLSNKSGKKIKKSHRPSTKAVLLAWFTGAVGMWGLHFWSAAKLSSETGLAICGITAGNTPGWIIATPDWLIMLLLLICGMIFLKPVFHPDLSRRITPLRSVIFLFTSCVSCSILGLWVAFSAASASIEHAAPLLTVLRNPIPMSVRSDQEFAGMIMWVPGCIFYVAASLHILIKWMDTRNEALFGNEKSLLVKGAAGNSEEIIEKNITENKNRL